MSLSFNNFGSQFSKINSIICIHSTSEHYCTLIKLYKNWKELLPLYIRAGSHGGPKPQHGGKVLSFEPQETVKMWLIIIQVRSLLFYAKIITGLVLRVGSSFLLDPILNTSPKPHLRKAFAM